MALTALVRDKATNVCGDTTVSPVSETALRMSRTGIKWTVVQYHRDDALLSRLPRLPRW